MFKRIFFLSLAAGFMGLSYQNCAGDHETLSSSAPPIDINPDEDPNTLEKKTSSTTYEPILADRYYISSLLTDVFGPRAEAVDTAGIPTDSANFGSPCSLYENYDAKNKAGSWSAVDPMAACGYTASSYLSAKTNAGASVTRQSQLAHACSDLTAHPTTLRFAVNRISTAADVPPFSRENLLTAFHLFYRNHPQPPPSLIDSLMVMQPASGPTLETWGQVIYTVCVSSHWQVL